MLRSKRSLFIMLVCALIPLKAQTRFTTDKLPRSWEEYLVSGNGVLGLMMSGTPGDEVLVVNHTNLFLPIYEPLTPPSQGNNLKTIRQLMLHGEYEKASQLLVDISHNDGFGKKRQSDLFIPAFKVSIKNGCSEYGRYSRGTDFMTGEMTASYTYEKDKIVHRAFVSRKNGVAVARLSSGKGRLSDTVHIEQVRIFELKRKIKFSLSDNFNIAKFEKDIQTDKEGAWLTVKVLYEKPWKNGYQGYQGIVRILCDKRHFKIKGDKLILNNADDVTIIVMVAPFKNMGVSHIESMKAELLTSKSYDEMLKEHASIQSELMNRVTISLPDTMENLRFNAARYNIISSTGINPPNLQGIWGATMTPPWSGDYTTNGNLPTAVAHYLQAGTPELMLPLFDKLESQMDEFRTNARVLFGARGIHIPSHICLHGYDTQFDATWPMTFWTAGAAWYAMFYYDYYLYTLDEQFLRSRALPFMEEAVSFYEDFLEEDSTGHLMFNPSYSPENHPANSKSQACINATMDVMAAKSLLRDIIEVSKHLGINGGKIPLWQSMLDRLPPYQLNGRGELREWMWGGMEDNHQHRHASHLLGLFYRNDPEIMGDERLKEGVRRAVNSRLNYRMTADEGPVMAFGVSQLAFPAAAIGDAETAYKLLNYAARNYWNPNFMTTHDEHSIFNTDMSGAYPAMIMKMLAQSDYQPLTDRVRIDLLPACPSAWKHGSLSGMLLRGGIKLDSLSWDESGDVRFSLKSKSKKTVDVYVCGKYKETIVVCD